MKPHISTLLNAVARKKKIDTVHCVGHSLGGALATLCASWLKAGKKTTYLYTYGSPRVGLHSFVNDITTRMGSNNIYRVYHKTDPVPVIPAWPYIHVPESGTDYLLYSSGGFFTAQYHAMSEYCDRIKKNNWSVLTGFREAPKSEQSIMQWLKSKVKAFFNLDSILTLNDALIFVLKKCGYIIPKTIESGFSLLDGIAYVLKKGLSLIATVSKWILLFIKKLLEILGVVREVKADLISKDFLRELLTRLHEKVSIEAQKALRLGLA